MITLRTFLILIFTALITNSCYYAFYNRKPKTTSIKIRLEKKHNTERLFTYENISSVTYLDIQDIIKLLNKKRNDSKLCEPKRIKYKALIDRLSLSDRNGFDIDPSTNPVLIKKWVPNFDTTKTGYAPLDFYSRGFGADLTSKKWIPRYGFEPIFVDTLCADRYNELYTWIITDLILKGKAQIFRKSDSTFQDFMIYEIEDFGDGHGGEDLLFRDKKFFMNVNVYSDIFMDDFECMDSTEMKNYWGY
ncbi:MAG: hypothetical protein IPO21_07505 [Bacteroidales bacterium]|nr:hypothetical protein [Bacteroidales bacterium]